MKIVSFLFILIASLFFSNEGEKNIEILDLNRDAECSEMETSDTCDLNIWKIIWENGEFRCETGQNFPCIPCQEERELEEI